MTDSATVQETGTPENLPNQSPDDCEGRDSSKRIVITIDPAKKKPEAADAASDAAEAEDASRQPNNAKKPFRERPRDDYPRTIEPLPPKPDYGPVEKQTDSLERKIREKQELRASLWDKINSFEENLKKMRLDRLDEETRTRLVAVRQEFSALVKEKAEILNKLKPIKERMRATTGNTKEKASFASIEKRIADLTDTVEHTSVCPEEEKEIRATIRKLSEQLKCRPQVSELEEQLDKLSEAIAPVKKEKEELEEKVKQIMQQSNGEHLTKAETLANLKDLRRQVSALAAEINELTKSKKSLLSKFKQDMFVFTLKERRFEAQTKYRAFLRKKWATLCDLINGAGASIVEEGDESGVFVVSSYPLTELPERPARGDRLNRKAGFRRGKERRSREPNAPVSIDKTIEVAKSGLAQWCEEALKSDKFGTIMMVKTGKKMEVSVNKNLCNFLEILELGNEAVKDKEAVLKTLKMCRNESEEEQCEQEAKAAESAEEAHARAIALEEKKQKSLSDINGKIEAWLREMVDFKAVIKYA